MELVLLGVIAVIIVLWIASLRQNKQKPPKPIDYYELEKQIRKIVEKILDEKKRETPKAVRPQIQKDPEPKAKIVKIEKVEIPEIQEGWKDGDPFLIILDIETSGLRKYRHPDPENLSNWPRIVQIAYQVFDVHDKEVDRVAVIFKQPRPLPPESIEIHGITDEMCKQFGVKPEPVLTKLYDYSQKAKYLAGHNIEFDFDVIEANMRRFKITDDFEMEWLCTMQTSKELKKLKPKDKNGRTKMPTLGELHDHLFGFVPEKLHNAEEDMLSVSRCFFEMKKRGLFKIEKA